MTMGWCQWHRLLFSLLTLNASIPSKNDGVGVFCFAVTSLSGHGHQLKHHTKRGLNKLPSSVTLPKSKQNTMSANQVIARAGGGGGGDAISRTTSSLALPSSSSLSSSSSSSAATTVEDPSSAVVGVWPCNDELDKKIIQIALPCIANFAINPLVGAVDLFWVGRMGNALAIAGQSAANQVFSSTYWLASYLPSVTATLVSKEHAKGDKEGVQDAICQALFIALILSIFGTGLIFLKPDLVLSSVLAKDAPAMEFARPYLMIRGFAFLPSLISTISFSAFRGILDTVTPLKISLFSNAFNAAVDPALIFRCGMGVTGAALATLGAEIISAVAFMYLMFKGNLVRWSKLLRLPKWTTLKPLLLGGAALQLRNLSLNIAFLSVARVTQSIDNTGVAAAAHSIAIQVFQVGGIVLLALSTVAQTLVPNEMVEKVDAESGVVTSGGLHSAKALVNRLMSWGFLLGTILGAFQILLLPIIHKFTPLEEVQVAARLPSIIASILQIINGLVFIGEGVMIGCGNFLTVSISTVVATLGILGALKVFPAKYGLAGVWMSFGVFNTLRLCGVLIHQTRIGPLASRNLKKKTG